MVRIATAMGPSAYRDKVFDEGDRHWAATSGRDEAVLGPFRPDETVDVESMGPMLSVQVQKKMARLGQLKAASSRAPMSWRAVVDLSCIAALPRVRLVRGAFGTPSEVIPSRASRGELGVSGSLTEGRESSREIGRALGSGLLVSSIWSMLCVALAPGPTCANINIVHWIAPGAISECWIGLAPTRSHCVPLAAGAVAAAWFASAPGVPHPAASRADATRKREG